MKTLRHTDVRKPRLLHGWFCLPKSYNTVAQHMCRKRVGKIVTLVIRRMARRCVAWQDVHKWGKRTTVIIDSRCGVPYLCHGKSYELSSADRNQILASFLCCRVSHIHHSVILRITNTPPNNAVLPGASPTNRYTHTGFSTGSMAASSVSISGVQWLAANPYKM